MMSLKAVVVGLSFKFFFPLIFFPPRKPVTQGLSSISAVPPSLVSDNHFKMTQTVQHQITTTGTFPCSLPPSALLSQLPTPHPLVSQ